MIKVLSKYFYFYIFFLSGTPSIILIPAVQQATLGNTVQFTCFSYRAAWKHERGNLPENAVTYYVGNKTLLTIINVQWKNEGKYTCQKFQNRLYFDVTALLIVNCKFFFKNITTSSELLQFQEIKCSIMRESYHKYTIPRKYKSM